MIEVLKWKERGSKDERSKLRKEVKEEEQTSKSNLKNLTKTNKARNRDIILKVKEHTNDPAVVAWR